MVTSAGPGQNDQQTTIKELHKIFLATAALLARGPFCSPEQNGPHNNQTTATTELRKNSHAAAALLAVVWLAQQLSQR
jgi:hypothetical protein